MFVAKFRSALIALLVGAAGVTGVAAPAVAQDVRFGIRIDDGRVRIDRDHHRPRYDRDYRRDRRADLCSPRDAARKASHMGVRRAQVTDVGRRSIKVEGRSRGDWAVARFARAPGCPVISFRR